MSAPPTSSSSTAPPATNEPKPSYRRDLLVDIESRVQQRWEAAQIWETEAADAKTRKPEEKYLATFPYPYMNGVLHLGHAFTLSKVDFECQYQRLKGKNVLFPFGYHWYEEQLADMERANLNCTRSNTNRLYVLFFLC